MFLKPLFIVGDSLFDHAFVNTKLVIFVHYVDFSVSSFTVADIFISPC